MSIIRTNTTSNSQHDPRVYVDIRRLAEFKHLISSFSLHPSNKAGSLMSGQHLSHYRGRGLNFEEYRHYQAGDDVRSIDWRVTARTRQPHIKVFTEEKDLPVVLLVDQRQSMLFSSQDTMKSVVAAEIAALCAWQVVKDSDRVGALIFNDKEQHFFSPKRSQTQTYQILKKMEEMNHGLSLKAIESAKSPQDSLNDALKWVSKLSYHGALFVVISDFKGSDSNTKKLIQKIRTTNGVIGVHIQDALEKELSGFDQLFVSDGESQLAIGREHKVIERYKAHTTQQNEQLSQWFRQRDFSLIEIGTDGQHIKNFQRGMRI